MKDVEAELIGYRSRGAEMLLTFAIQRDDLPRVKDMVEMIGHCFELDIRHIDYDNPQPAQEGNPVRQPARALYARVGILSGNPGFWDWAADRYPEHVNSANGARGEDLGAHIVREVTHVSSRKEIVPGTEAELIFNLLESAYESSIRKT